MPTTKVELGDLILLKLVESGRTIKIKIVNGPSNLDNGMVNQNAGLGKALGLEVNETFEYEPKRDGLSAGVKTAKVIAIIEKANKGEWP